MTGMKASFAHFEPAFALIVACTEDATHGHAAHRAIPFSAPPTVGQAVAALLLRPPLLLELRPVVLHLGLKW